MTSIFDAHSLAIRAHAGQVDKGGQPYIRHLERVANAAAARAGHARSVNRIDVDPMMVMQAALLHDVLEDTATTAGDLTAAGFGDEVLAMVLLLTKPKQKIPYSEAIDRIIESNNLGAILIKMSDNEDNLSPHRTLPNGEALAARYRTAFGRLTDAAGALGYTGG
ncbi:MAG: HD domain-containing protein [Methylobacterium sp.]|uniref:HD domain-containing protein n=1 Tax=Methylobacterium sp. TaxID=409 RepID=UPI0025CD9FF7|nr:HD domain-containing protein [Methylobacterium sp.]MBX9930152.1 HD domain-containing protein [Methylobacterium sp.]